MNWKKNFKKNSYAYKFLELAQPDSEGFSREVKLTEFDEKNSIKKFGNGADWARKGTKFAQIYNVKLIKSFSKGHPIVGIKLNGFNKQISANLSQTIRADIKKVISPKRCVVLGTNRSCDHKTEVDHKDGRKVDPRIMNPKTQLLSDFQPLSKPANDAKRQFCKECAATGQRYDAKKLGYTVSVTQGDLNYTQKLGCKGCFWFDPIAFRQKLKMNK